MADDIDDELHGAVNEALEALALHLGGTTETGGPVANATQIKGRGELGVLLTDAQDLVLGRVWIEFGGEANAPDMATVASQAGSIGLHASVRAEAIEPPMSIEDWVVGR